MRPRILATLTFCLGFSASLSAAQQTIAASNTTHTETATNQRAEPQRLSDVRRGSLMFRSEQTAQTGDYLSAPSLSTDVRIQVTGPIARSVLRQRFVNPSELWAEAIYAFPLPQDAAVDHMRLHIGDRIIEGDIQEKQQARETYQAAKAAGKRSALVEQARPNLFTTTVANIPPHGEILVELEYQQELQWRDGTFSLRFPMAITPRYKPADTTPIEQTSTLANAWSLLPGELPNAADLSLTQTDDGQRTQHNPVSLHLVLRPGFEIGELESLYQPITQQQLNGETHIELADTSTASDRDFLLRWKPRDAAAVQAAWFVESGPAGDYALLMLMPPQQAYAASLNQAREVIFIIDTSGSMGGESIRAAKAGLQAGLDYLSPGDRFNLIEFNDQSTTLFSQPQEADQQHLQQARQWTSRLKAGGGTEMRSALQSAFSQDLDPGVQRLRQIVFITDGAVSNEAELMSMIHAQLGNARLFTVGIGSAPNAYFMTEAAHFGRGSFSYIGHSNEVQERMQTLFARLDHPALTDLNLDLPVASDALPNPLPDLYAGEPVNIVMKLDGLPNKARLSGLIGSRPWTNDLDLAPGAAKNSADSSGIGMLWARRKITDWERQGRTGLGQDQVRAEIIQLALQHHLVSDYTSLVAVDKTPARDPQDPLNSHALKSNLPAGMDMSTPMASGASPSWALMLAGLLLCLLGMVSRYCPLSIRHQRCAA